MDPAGTPKPPRKFGWGAISGAAAAAATAGLLANLNVYIDTRDTIIVTGNTITHACPCTPSTPLRP